VVHLASSRRSTLLRLIAGFLSTSISWVSGSESCSQVLVDDKVDFSRLQLLFGPEPAFSVNLFRHGFLMFIKINHSLSFLLVERAVLIFLFV